MNDHDSELDDSSEEETAGAIESEDAGELALQKEEKGRQRMRKRKAAEALSRSKTGAKLPENDKSASSAQAAEAQARKAARRIRLSGLLSAKRQSSRAHALEVAGAVEKKLEEEAAKRVY